MSSSSCISMLVRVIVLLAATSACTAGPSASISSICFAQGVAGPLNGQGRTKILGSRGAGGGRGSAALALAERSPWRQGSCNQHSKIPVGGGVVSLRAAPERLGPVTMDEPINYELLNEDGLARRGRLHFRRGNWTAETPAFMSVGTMGAVRNMASDEVKEAGTEILLSNTFHLMLRPGTDVIEAAGDLHDFMRWDGPILTDSGGFQVWSLEGKKVSEEGVEFRSNVDGKKIFLSPEKAMQVQASLGSDMVMVLDECLEFPATEERASESLDRTLRWARRSKDAYRGGGAVFGIVQGGAYESLRLKSLQGLLDIGFDGYAVGGMSVGEPEEKMLGMMSKIIPKLPRDKARYVMGVGKPEQLVEGVRRGVDMFDCVLPTRNAENGQLFTQEGHIQVRNAEYTMDQGPIEVGCGCYTCRNGYTRSYLRHLLRSKVMLGARLAIVHNTYYIQTLMSKLRNAIAQGRLEEFVTEWYAVRGTAPPPISD